MQKSFHLKIILFFILGFSLFISCEQKEEVTLIPFPKENKPWQKIRKDRIEKLLPLAMERANVDSWIVICRENNNDPLAVHIGGENAGGTAAFIYFLKDKKVKSIAISPEGEADALAETGVVDSVIKIERGFNIWEKVKEVFNNENPKTISINSSEYTIAY